MKISTQAIRSGYQPHRHDGAVQPPLHLSSTFVHGNEQGYEYSRSGNPTRDIFERLLADLEGGQYGLAFSSGSAALALIAELFAPGEHVIFSTDAYGGTYRYFTKVGGPRGLQYSTVDTTVLAEIEAAIRPGTKMIWIETPTNPLLKINDIAAIAELAKRHGFLLVVDNTFATPVSQLPLSLGADMVVHSTTKYLNGHSDSIGGAVVLNDVQLFEKLKFLQNAIGAILSPFDAWLQIRGLRTLVLRMKQHEENGRLIFEYLKSHPLVKSIYYPGDPTSPYKKIVQKQMKLVPGMISFELDVDLETSVKFLKSLKLFTMAESLGGVESLIEHPASMTHASIPREERLKIGLTDGLIRMSVGIEDGQDLLDDLRQAFAVITSAKPSPSH
jgi:cystathionine gamma-lyase